MSNSPARHRPPTGVIAAQQTVTSYSIGPLPPADEFAKYDRALPGAAERMMAMAEEESKHRRECDVQIISDTTKIRSTGQWTAFIVAMSALAIAGVCAFVGQQIASVSLAITACVGLATVFIKRIN